MDPVSPPPKNVLRIKRVIVLIIGPIVFSPNFMTTGSFSKLYKGEGKFNGTYLKSTNPQKNTSKTVSIGLF